jgi:hypothetical protein
MKLQTFSLPVSVLCLKCGRWITSGVLDRDGPAFKAYYCHSCAPAKGDQCQPSE